MKKIINFVTLKEQWTILDLILAGVLMMAWKDGDFYFSTKIIVVQCLQTAVFSRKRKEFNK